MSTELSRQLAPFLELRIDNHDIYHKLPYKKDIYLCPPESVRLISGNVVKYYTIIPEEPIILDTNDLAEHLVALGKEESRRYHSHFIDDPENVIDQEDVISGEQGFQAGLAAQALVRDTDPDTQKSPAAAEPQQVITNPFLDVSEDDDDYSFLGR